MSTLKLDTLPDIVIDTIFNFLPSDQLFDLRFLNKTLFKQINLLIFNHLCYSAYSSSSTYSHIQHSFYEHRGINVQYLKIKGDQLNFLTLCPNIVILDVEYTQLTDIDILNNLIPQELHYLKNMILKIRIDQQFILFKHIALLYQIKKLTVSVNDSVDLDHLINLLDPYKLKVLQIKCTSVNLNGISKLKELFKELKKLVIISETFSIPLTLNNNNNFQSLETLKIKGIPVNKVPLNYLGDIFKIKSVFININDFIHNYTTRPIHPTMQSFGFNKPIYNINSLFNVTHLKEIYISGTTTFESAFRAILLLNSVQTLTIHNLNYVYRGFCLRHYLNDHLNKKAYKLARGVVSCFLSSTSIKKVIFKGCDISANNLFDILFLLNNIKVVNFINGRCYYYIDKIEYGFYKKTFLIQFDRESIKNSLTIIHNPLSYFKRYATVIVDILE